MNGATRIVASRSLRLGISRLERMPRKRSARMAREQRHEGVAGQAEPTEGAIGDERRPRQIARVLEQADEEEEQTDLRQKDHRAGDPADHAFDQQVPDRARACRAASSHPPSRPKIASIMSIGTDANEKIDQNRPNITRAKIAVPASGWVSTRSTRSVRFSPSAAPDPASRRDET